MAVAPKWRKILYEDQRFPDNYVDESFLDELKKNLYPRTYSYRALLVETGPITQQLSSVGIFVVSFMYMEEKWLSPQLLMLVTALATLMLYFVNILVTANALQDLWNRTYMEDVKSAFMVPAITFILSPVLVSLTETFSTDTIYAVTTVMFLANLLFHDYTTTPNRGPNALSLCAAIFASVCLASRLHTLWHAFATVTFSFQLFALWPVLRRHLQRYFATRGRVVMTTVMTTATFSALVSVTTVGAVLYATAFLFITFVCPAWFINLQPYKKYHGWTTTANMVACDEVHPGSESRRLKPDIMVSP